MWPTSLFIPVAVTAHRAWPVSYTHLDVYKRQDLDKSLPLRKSHENPDIQTIYQEFFDHPLSHKAHELLHTEYFPRPKRYDFSPYIEKYRKFLPDSAKK